MIVLVLTAGAVGIVRAKAQPPIIVYAKTMTTMDKYDKWGEEQGFTMWSKAEDGDKKATFNNFVFPANETARVNIIPNVQPKYEDSWKEIEYEYAHLWFTRKYNPKKPPAFPYYPWLGEYIADTYPLNWTNTSSTSILITPYYHNKWVMHYTFVRDKDNVGELDIDQAIDDYTINTFAISKQNKGR